MKCHIPYSQHFLKILLLLFFCILIKKYTFCSTTHIYRTSLHNSVSMFAFSSVTVFTLLYFNALLKKKKKKRIMRMWIHNFLDHQTSDALSFLFVRASQNVRFSRQEDTSILRLEVDNTKKQFCNGDWSNELSHNGYICKLNVYHSLQAVYIS